MGQSRQSVVTHVFFSCEFSYLAFSRLSFLFFNLKKHLKILKWEKRDRNRVLYLIGGSLSLLNKHWRVKGSIFHLI